MSGALRRPWRGAAVALLVAAVLACRIEDRTPTGARRDEQAIQHLLVEYHRALAARDSGRMAPLLAPGASYDELVIRPGALVALGASDLRMVRMDVHQEGDLAAAWVTTRRGDGLADASADHVEHFVLRRLAGGWKVQHVARATGLPVPGLGR